MLLSLFEPLLSMDGSAAGSASAESVRRWYRDALDALLADDTSGAAEVEAALKASPELQLDEELPGAGFYRTGFIVALLYSINAYQGSGPDSYLHRFDELPYFLVQDHPGVLEGVDVGSLAARVLEAFERTGPEVATAALESELAAAAGRLRANLPTARRDALQPEALAASVRRLDPKPQQLFAELLGSAFEPVLMPGAPSGPDPAARLTRLVDAARRLAANVPDSFDGVDFDGLVLHALTWFEAFDEDWAVEELQPEVARAAQRVAANLAAGR